MRTTTAPRTATVARTARVAPRTAPAYDAPHVTRRPSPVTVVVGDAAEPAGSHMLSDIAKLRTFADTVIVSLVTAEYGLDATCEVIHDIAPGMWVAHMLCQCGVRLPVMFGYTDASVPAPLAYVAPHAAPAPRKLVTPQVAALPGMSPLGLKPAAEPAPARVAKALPAPAIAADMKAASAAAHAVTVRVIVAGHGAFDVACTPADIAEPASFTRNHVAPRVAQFHGWPRVVVDYANRAGAGRVECAVSHGSHRQLASFATVRPGLPCMLWLPARLGMGGAARPEPATSADKVAQLAARMGVQPAGSAVAAAEAKARAAGIRLSRTDRAAAEAVDAARRVSAAGKAPVAAAPRMSAGTAAIFDAASRGVVPAAPDFTAETHTRYRPKLAALVALVNARDVSGLKAMQINPISTSPKALDRYRNAAVIALTAQASAARKA